MKRENRKPRVDEETKNAALEALAKANGGVLKPETVVAAAKQETHPLHNCFEWNNDAAAVQWRLQQARMLIRCAVYHEEGDGEPVSIKVFYSLTPDREQQGGGYRLASEVLSSEELYQQLLTDALGEMQRFQNKYSQIKELRKVIAAMDEVIATN